MRQLEHVLISETTKGGKDGNIIDIKGASKVTLFCTRSSHSSGNSVFSATVGVAGNFVTYSKWISNATNTNSQTLTRVASLTLNSNASNFLTMSPEDTFEQIKVSVNTTTDGTADAWLVIVYED